MTGSESTHYIVLHRIFSHVSLTEEDSFIDVGCGKGRVLAYLLKKRKPCKLFGIEINEISGKVALEWTEKYDQVKISLGNAFHLDYNPYTVMFMGRPFLPKTFLEFIEKLEKTLTHPITLIYWVDQQSGYYLNKRSGWKMCFREEISTLYGFKIARIPQYYSIWVYDPIAEEKL